MMCYYDGTNIKSLKIDGIDPTEPITNHKNNFEIKASNIIAD